MSRGKAYWVQYQSNPRGEGGVGFLVQEYEAEFVSNKYKGSIYIKFWAKGERKHCTYSLCICLCIVTRIWQV